MKGTGQGIGQGTGLKGLIGKQVLLMCANYFYTGKLTDVDSWGNAVLADPAIVYETGAWSDGSYKDIQKLHVPVWYVALLSIESFGLSK